MRSCRPAVIALFLFGTAVAAQSPTTAGATAGCTYASCALRLEPVFFGMAVVRGSGGEQVSRLGGFGGGVDVLLAGSDSAAAYARTYVHATRRSTVLGLLGGVAYAVVMARTDNFRNDADGTDVAIGLGGAGLVIAAIPFSLRAQRSLARSIWWYNAALPR